MTSLEKSIRTWEVHMRRIFGNDFPDSKNLTLFDGDSAPESLFVLKFIRLVLNSMQIFTIYNVL